MRWATMTVAPSLSEPERRGPALWGRRLVARLLDWLLAGAISAVVCWPLAWGQASDALARAGVTSAGDLLQSRDLASLSDAVLTELQPVVVLTLGLQVFLVWLYETLATLVTSTTVGKGLVRVRVVVDPPGHVFLGTTEPRRPPSGRPLRLALRAALVTAPPGVAVVGLAGAVLGVEEAAEVSMAAIAITIGSLIISVVGGKGLHGDLTRTQVVRFDWQQVQADARRRGQEASTRVEERARAQGVGTRVEAEVRSRARQVSAHTDRLSAAGREALPRRQQAEARFWESQPGRWLRALQGRG